jgi:predicted HicB family RNase H-like nuclease
MEKKPLDHYLNQDYDIIVVRVDDEGEYEYKAYAKELGEFAIYGTGSTKVKAIEHFEKVRKEIFEYYYENNIPIPEPVRDEDVKYSGKFIIRTTSYIHKLLVETANGEGISLNQHINNILHSYSSAAGVMDMAKRKFDQLLEPSEKRYLGICPGPTIYMPEDKSVSNWAKQMKMAG